MKKVILFFALLSIVLFSSSVNALTEQERQNLINQIQQQIYQLQLQLQAQTQSQNQINGIWCYNFSQDLSVGSYGQEVYNLKTALNKEGLLDVSLINYNFDTSAYDAVIAFQNKYKKEILTPNGLKYATGKVGQATRAKLNKIYSCSLISNCTPSWICSDWSNCSNNKQTRKCSDARNCNTVLGKPLESQPCTTPKVEILGNNIANKVSINYGESLVLSWQSTNVVSCFASGNWSGSKNTSGLENLGNLISSRIYNISCVDAYGKIASDTLTVNVISSLVNIKLNGSDSTIYLDAGKSVKISWTAEGVKSCRATGDWSGLKELSGSESTGFLYYAKKYIYGIICLKEDNQSISDVVEVIVNSPVVTIKANSKIDSLEILSGSNVNLSWIGSGVVSCNALGDWSGVKKISGSESVSSILSSKFYVIECSDNLGNKISDTVSVSIK